MITERWNNILQSINPEYRDIYFTEEYHRLNIEAREQAKAFVYTEGEMIMVFPFLSREWATEDGVWVKDFESAYGYGGPIYNTADINFIRRSLNEFVKEVKSEGYLAGFVRFHPLLENYKQFEIAGDLIYDRKTIAINLNQSIEDVWMNEIHTKNRNVIKKGEKEGLSFVADNDFITLPDFKRLYESTMDKLSADSYYYFSEDYFNKLKTLLPDSFIGNVSYQGEIIASAIFFYDGIYGHYHLAGSNVEKLSLSPNNYLLWAAAQELKNRNVKWFHLGGGVNSDEKNSLFQFKRKFSKSTRDFYIGKMIFNKSLYNDVCHSWEQRNPDKIGNYGNRLLKYRY